MGVLWRIAMVAGVVCIIVGICALTVMMIDIIRTTYMEWKGRR